MPPSLPLHFTKRKALILAQLSLPASEYDDLSPKGSIDEGIRHVIEGLNAREGWVTTSSCAGRVCVFLEGERVSKSVSQAANEARREDGEDDGGGDGGGDGKGDGHANAEGSGGDDGNAEISLGSEEVRNLAGVGGKGGGGRWLFVSHEPVDVAQITGDKSASSFLGMRSMGVEEDAIELGGKPFTEERLVHFKFEPMILHILTASLSHAQVLLKAALQAGFRESGALSLVSATSEPPLPMVAVRTIGPALDCIVGRLTDDGDCVSIVGDAYLKGLLNVANRRFEENSKRIARFYDLLFGSTSVAAGIGAGRKQEGIGWEDKVVRRERMRAEGLKRSQESRVRGNNGIDS